MGLPCQFRDNSTPNVYMVMRATKKWAAILRNDHPWNSSNSLHLFLSNPGSKLPAMLKYPCPNCWTACRLLNRVRRHGDR